MLTQPDMQAKNPNAICKDILIFHCWVRVGIKENRKLYILTSIHFTPTHLEESKSQRGATSSTGMLSNKPQQDQYHHKQRVRPHGAHMWREGHRPCSTSQHKQHHPATLRSRLVEPPLVQILSFPGRSVPVGLHYCHPGTVRPHAQPNENVWRHSGNMKSIILTRLESLRPYLLHTYKQCFPRI